MIYNERNNPTTQLNVSSSGIGFATQYPVSLGKTLTSLATQNITPTTAQLLGGLISHASTTGAGTATLPTGTVLSAAIHPSVGDSFTTLYANTGSQTVTITGATGSTVVGTAAVATGLTALLTFVNTGTNTWNVYTNVSA